MWSGKCPVLEMSVRRNVLVGKRPVGNVSVGEVSVGELSSRKCELGNCPVGELSAYRIKSSHPELFLGKSVLKMCMQQILYTGEHPCQSAIYWTHNLTWVFSYKFAPFCYLFSEHLFRGTPLDSCFLLYTHTAK